VPIRYRYRYRYIDIGDISTIFSIYLPTTNVLFIAAPASTAQLRHVITGVAMATASDHLQLYFGCTAQTPIIGGAGLVRMRTPEDNFRFRSSEVVPVRTAAAESPLFAGSMFVIELEQRVRSDRARQSSTSRALPDTLCALSVFFHVILVY